MKGSIHKNHLLAYLIWLLSAFVYWQATEIPVLKTDLSVVGPAFFPEIIALLLTGLAAFVFFTANKDPDSRLFFTIAPELRFVIVFSTLILGYILLLPFSGFEVISMVFLITGMWVLGMRRPLVLVFVPAGITAIIHVIFIKIMHIPLPTFGQFF